ncbi:MAG TPA: ABC transporter ATP-binding protein [Candidatus Dormibacteraeota bacterium]|nr:ABC transporter ATP-binding protein [Candidatus Dormibacteraeota bacterium]
MLNIENVSKTIGNHQIIKDLSLHVDKGEVFGLLGPNGAGKTTIIRMIVGLAKITWGDIFINNISITHQKQAALKKVGAIVENPEFYNNMSGLGNLKQHQRLYPHISENQINNAVDFIELQHRIHEKVGHYSLGMKQRLGLAQAMLHHPDVLILDEPTNGLDPAGIKKIRGHINYLSKELGLTVIISSHLLSEIEQICDRAAIIDEGKLITIQHLNKETATQMTYEFTVQDMSSAINVLTQHNIQAYTNKNKLHVTINKPDLFNVIKLMVDHHIKFTSLTSKEKTLEDYFIKITNKGVNDNSIVN